MDLACSPFTQRSDLTMGYSMLFSRSSCAVDFQTVVVRQRNLSSLPGAIQSILNAIE